MTGLYGVIGDPIAHSLSPLIHKGWMRDHHLDADYVAMQVPDGELPDALKTLAKRGCQGVNITLPHKLSALACADAATEQATRIGAANTLWLKENGCWGADNTDVPGFAAALKGHYGQSVTGKNILVLGAGGSARAVIDALDSGGANIVLANRTTSKAEALLKTYPGGRHLALSLADGLARAKEADIVINTTSLGHSGQRLELPTGHGRLFFDISYGKAAESIRADASAQGWETADGLSMLVHQAAFSFQRWFGIEPDVGTGLDRARRVVEAV